MPGVIDNRAIELCVVAPGPASSIKVQIASHIGATSQSNRTTIDIDVSVNCPCNNHLSSEGNYIPPNFAVNCNRAPKRSQIATHDFTRIYNDGSSKGWLTMLVLTITRGILQVFAGSQGSRCNPGEGFFPYAQQQCREQQKKGKPSYAP